MNDGTSFTTVYLGMGGNLGQPQKLFDRSLELLGQHPSCLAIRESQRLESKPIDADGPNYLNSVIEMKWRGSPQELLALCMATEQELGRVRSTHNAPRLIDLDVLLFGQEVVNEANLTIPHPRMHQRRFVLEPLLELWPLAQIPGIESVQDCLLACKSQEVRPV